MLGQAATRTHIAGKLIKPVSVYDYLDVVQVWVREPWCESERRIIKAHTAKVLWANQLGINQPAWWDHRYKQFIKLCRPRKQAIEVLAERDDALITYSELARDYILADECQVWHGLRLSAKHFNQKWHNSRRMKVWPNGNWRSGNLHKKGMVIQAYGDQPSKVTGEVDCLHLEAKITGSSACKRAGISHPKDLLDFDFDGFWKRYLTFVDVDRRRLGR